MKRIIFVFIAGIYIWSLGSHSATEGFAEISVRSDLENILSKIIKKDNFLVQVSGIYKPEKEKRLLESELIQKSPSYERPSALPPELPGFEVTGTSGTSEIMPAEYKKEVYQFSEKDKLTKLNVQIFYNETLSSETVSKIKEIANAYLQNQINIKHSLSFTPFLPLPSEIASEEKEASLPIEQYFLWALTGLLALALIWALIRLTRKPKKEEAFSSAPSVGPNEAITGPKVNDIERSHLLEGFLRDPSAFRAYYMSLTPENRAAISQALTGPAFSALKSALDLQTLEEALVGSETDEHNLSYYIRDFADFLKTYNWQNSRFFGFLPHYNDDAIIALFRELPATQCAVVARFISKERMAKIFVAMPEGKRKEIIRNARMAALMPLEEMSKIEASVRHYLSLMPSSGTPLVRSDYEFLKDIVESSDDQESILRDIKDVDEKSYEKLAKLRFNIEDIPNMPVSLVSKVLSEFDNKQLSIVLNNIPEEISNYLLGLLPENRRSLILSQRKTLTNIAALDIDKARKEFVALFRKG